MLGEQTELGALERYRGVRLFALLPGPMEISKRGWLPGTTSEL